MNFQTMSKQRKMILIAAAVGVISMFLPWVSISLGVFGGGSVNGMHGSGIFVFLCFVAAGAIAYLGDQTAGLNQTNWMIALIAGGVAALIMLINFFDAVGSGFLSIGFYGALIASLAIVAFAFMFRSAGLSLQSGFDSLKGDLERKMASNTTHSSQPNMTGTTTTVSKPTTDEPTRPTA